MQDSRCNLAVHGESSAAGRRRAYRSILKATPITATCNLQIFMEKDPDLYHQIHVDARRSLWRFMKYLPADIVDRVSSDAPLRAEAASWIAASDDISSVTRFLTKDGTKLAHAISFVRFHQQIFEKFICDVLAQDLPFKSYYQGFTDILEPLYYSFLEPVMLSVFDTNAAFLNFLQKSDALNSGTDDFPPIHETEFTILTSSKTYFADYSMLLGLAYTIARDILYPFMNTEPNTVVSIVSASFEPILRMVDSELYTLMGRHPDIAPTCQGTLMAQVITACIHESGSAYSCTRFLDAAVAGGWVFILFMAACAQSICMRLYTPQLFEKQNTNPSDSDPAETPKTLGTMHKTVSDSGSVSSIKTFRPLADPAPFSKTDVDILICLHSCMSSVEEAMPLIADNIIRMAFCAALLAYYAKDQPDDLHKYITNNFGLDIIMSGVDRRVSGGRRPLRSGQDSFFKFSAIFPGKVAQETILEFADFKMMPYINQIIISCDSDRRNNFAEELRQRGAIQSSSVLTRRMKTDEKFKQFFADNWVVLSTVGVALAVIGGVIAGIVGAVTSQRKRQAQNQNQGSRGSDKSDL